MFSGSGPGAHWEPRAVAPPRERVKEKGGGAAGTPSAGAVGPPRGSRSPFSAQRGWGISREKAKVDGIRVIVAGRKHPGTVRSSGQAEIFA